MSGKTNGSEKAVQNFPSGSRYPEDYLSKPRLPASNSRKRITDDTAVETIEEKEDDKGNIKKKRKGSTESVVEELAIDEEEEITDNDATSTTSSTGLSKLNKPSNTGNSSSSSSTFSSNLSSLVSSAAISASTAAAGAYSYTSTSLPTMTSMPSSSSISSHLKIPQPPLLYQQQNQIQGIKSGHLRDLRNTLGTDQCIINTGLAINIVTNNPILFQGTDNIHSEYNENNNGKDKKIAFTANQFLYLLQARRNIDEVISNILLTL